MENTPQQNNELPPEPQVAPINPPAEAPAPATSYAPAEPVSAEPIQPVNPFFGPVNTSVQPSPSVVPATFVAPVDAGATTTTEPAATPVTGVPTLPVKKSISKKIIILVIGGVVSLLAITVVFFYLR